MIDVLIDGPFIHSQRDITLPMRGSRNQKIIDLSKYFVEKGYKTGHPRCDAQKLLKVILFAFMENGSWAPLAAKVMPPLLASESRSAAFKRR